MEDFEICLTKAKYILLLFCYAQELKKLTLNYHNGVYKACVQIVWMYQLYPSLALCRSNLTKH